MQHTSMKGKRCLVTGANSGIGFSTALALAQMGASVTLVCRSLEKANNAKAAIEQQTGNYNVDVLLADFADQSSIRAMANRFKAQHEQLDVLVNNAGVIADVRRETADGYEYTFAVNHLGYFITTCLLIDVLLAAPQGRIVSVSSEAHRVGSIHFSDLHLRKGYSNIKAYAQSKLANILFTKSLAAKLQGTSVTANCLHPGVVNTNFAGDGSWLWRGLMTLAKPFMVSPQKGALTPVYLATEPSLSETSGQYFSDCKPKQPSAEAQEDSSQARLWALSEGMTGVTLSI